jgi:hypothetical protein
VYENIHPLGGGGGGGGVLPAMQGPKVLGQPKLVIHTDCVPSVNVPDTGL